MKHSLRVVVGPLLLATALVILGLALVREVGDRSDLVLRLRPGVFALAILAIASGLVASSRAWQALVGGERELAVARAFFVSQAGKYLPGGIWQGMGQAGLGHAAGIPLRRAALAVPAHVATQVLGTLPVAGMGLAASAELPPGARACANLLLLPLIVLHPRVLAGVIEWGKRRVGTRIRWESLERTPILRSVLWSLASWIGYGSGFILCVRMLGWDGGSPWYLASSFALAWTVGFLVIVMPAGAGIREATLVLALEDTVPSGTILAAAIAYRVATLAAELALSLACTAAVWVVERTHPAHDT